ncbi:unnamed protein product [Lepeophtheirus salmonis]|uniref:(salmon louse) hypothetical protein n=1 Tax=Lepeophtheirus salmonis TaxID=72036 RepID=A0A7R8CSW7_LEPSM|nr:unnamed protein product [Lepeophtheirus salmonis]CAF2920858.1 unnamed protein product [Lepeophtheirus salmonis]
MTQDPTAIQFPDSMNDSKNITVVPSHQKADQEKDYENETSTSNEDYESTNQSTVSIIDMFFSTYAPDILSESDTLNQVQDDDTVDVESTTLEIRSTCLHNGVTYQDFDDIASNDPCEVCYCNYGQVVCSKMVCNKLEGHEFCRPLPPKEGKCCPDQYECLSTTEDHMANVTIQSVTTKPLDPSGKCDRNGTIYENGADVPITSKCYNSCTCINTEFICDYLPCKEAPQLDGLTCTEVPVEGECCPMFKCDDLSSNEISTQIPLKNMNSTTSGPSSSETTLSTLDETSIGETTKDNVTDTSTLSMSQEVKDEGNESEIQEMTSTNASNVSETTVAPTESGIDSMNATNINATFPSKFVNNKETTVTPTEVTSSENMETVSVAYQTTEKSNTLMVMLKQLKHPEKNVTLNESNASTTPISEGATTSLDATTPSSTNISVDKFEENTTNFGSGIETTEKIDENVTNPSSETGTSENTNENATTVSGGFETSEKTDENATTVSSGTETSKETYENATTVSSGIETSKETDENATTVSSAIETSKETDENATTVSSAIETSETTDESATTVSSGTETLKETDENATTVSSGIETSKETDENTTTASSAIETSEKTDENATTVSSGTETSKETDENATSVSTGIGTDEKTDENATTVSSDIETSEKKLMKNTTTVSILVLKLMKKTDENATTVSSDIETSGKTDENTTTVSSDIETSTETEENATTFSSAIEISTETEENATTVSTGIETDENATTVSTGIETDENATTVSKTDENATTVSSAIEISTETEENATTVSTGIETDENATSVSSGIVTSEKTDKNATTVGSGIETSKETDENTTTVGSAIETDEKMTTSSAGDETSSVDTSEFTHSGNDTNTSESQNENVTSTPTSIINSTEESLSTTTPNSTSDDKVSTTIPTESIETTTFSYEYLPPTTADPSLKTENENTLSENGGNNFITTVSPVPSVQNTDLGTNNSSLASTATSVESQDNQSKPTESEIKTTTFSSIDASTHTNDVDSSSESDSEDQNTLNETLTSDVSNEPNKVTTELPKITDEEKMKLSSNLTNSIMKDDEIIATTNVPSIFESATSDKKGLDNATSDKENDSTTSSMENKGNEGSATTESSTLSSTTGKNTIINEEDMEPEAMQVVEESTLLTQANSTVVGEPHGSTFVFETTTKSSTTNKLKFCILNGMIVKNGGDVPDSDPCKLCSCYDGEVNCATQICAPPSGYENCTALSAEEGVCCPKYSCKTKFEAIEYDDADEDIEDNNEEDKELEDGSQVLTGNYSTEVPSASSSEPPVTTTVSATTGDVVGTASSDILDGEDVQDPSADSLKGTPISDAEGQVSLDSLGPGACLYDGKVYVSAQQIPRNNPCDFCFCFRGDICLQQSCPPPIPGCREEIIDGFCCPRYECPVTMGFKNVTEQVNKHSLVSWLFGDEESNSPETVTTQVRGCEIQGDFYEVGAIVKSASGPCLQCRCGLNEKLECEPQLCEPQPLKENDDMELWTVPSGMVMKLYKDSSYCLLKYLHRYSPTTPILYVVMVLDPLIVSLPPSILPGR